MPHRKRLSRNSSSSRSSHNGSQPPQDSPNHLPLIVGSFAVCLVTIVGVWIGTSLARESAPQPVQPNTSSGDDLAVQPRQEKTANRAETNRRPETTAGHGLTAGRTTRSNTLQQPALFAQNSEKPAAVETVRVFAEESRPTYGPQPDPAGGSGADFDSLIELITTTVSPDTWEDVGGPGTIDEYETGVRVDPQSRLSKISRADQQGRLEALADQIRRTNRQAVVTESSDLRIVSLPRLERAVSAFEQAGEPLPDSIRNLAGLTSVRYVFVYPEEGEVVIAGPAEPWRIDDEGRAIGAESERPALQLDDLVVILRTFAPAGQGIFGCSINPREANLKQVKQFVEASQAAGPLAPGTRGKWLREIAKRMGMQDVEIYGVPRNSRVAKIIFEADYRMKMIGIGKLDAGPRVPDFFKLVHRSRSVHGIPMKALRWWLTMKYDGVLHSPGRDAFEIRGSSVLVQSENQFVTAQGKRVQTGVAEPINRQFAENFTRYYNDVAQRDKVFAELQNVFDLAMAAAICRRDGLFELAGWDMGTFAPGGDYKVAEVDSPAPQEIKSVLNHRVFGGTDIVVQVAGGVVGNVGTLVNDKTLQGESQRLSQTHAASTHSGIPADRWWWDSAR